jgi:DNA-binding GntR family transcriptional regulator
MKIVPVPVTNQIADALRQRILKCEMQPGDRLVESALCAELGVSRPSLREAMGRLANENLLIHWPNRGYQVAEITLEGFQQLCELRVVVESANAKLAASRASEKQLTELSEAAEIQVDDAEELIEQNRRFHLAVADATGNPELADITRRVLDKDNQPYFYGIDLHACTTPKAISAEHLEIVAAIGTGDASQAEALMTSHIREKEKRIVAAWNDSLTTAKSG